MPIEEPLLPFLYLEPRFPSWIRVRALFIGSSVVAVVLRTSKRPAPCRRLIWDPAEHFSYFRLPPSGHDSSLRAPVLPGKWLHC